MYTVGDQHLFCDMETFGGGWTLLANVPNTSANWFPGANYSKADDGQNPNLNPSWMHSNATFNAEAYGNFSEYFMRPYSTFPVTYTWPQ